MAVNDDAKELGGILGEIKRAIEDLDGGFKKGSNSLQSIVDIASQYNDYQSNSIKLNSEQLSQLSKKLKNEKSSLESSQQSLQNSIAQNAQEKLKLQLQINSLKTQRSTKSEVSRLQKEYDNINNTLYEQETLFEQINDVLTDTNNQISEIEKGLDRAAKNEKLNERFGSLNSKAEKFGNILGISLTFSGLLSILKETDKVLADFSKSMNMTYSDSVKLKKEYGEIAKASGDDALNSTRLLETQSAIGEALGTNAKINEADLKTFTKLRVQAGYTNEELMGIQQLSLLNGKSLEKNTSEILGGAKAYASRNKMVVNEKQVLKEVSKASAALKLSLGGSTKALAESVVKAKQFGLTLEQTEKMSQSLLNFEDSIESELSAELLTGKNLNLERARGLALNGQTADAAAEIAAQVGSAADFGKMNVIQQEAIAKAVGMERNELAQSLMDKEALAKIGFKDAEAAKAKYDLYRKTMTAEQAATKLGNEELAKQYEQQGIQERFNNSMEKLKTILSDNILPAMKSMGDFLADHATAITGIVTAYITLRGLMMAQQVMSGISYALELKKKGIIDKENASKAIGIGLSGQELAKQVAIAAAWVIANPLLALGGLALAAGVGVLVASQMSAAKSMKDGVINPKGGMVVSGEKGSIQLDKNDSIIAGTNLGGGKSSGGGGTNANAVVNAIAELRRDINALANRPINVSMDGKKVIEATTGAQPNTQGDESRKNSYRMS
jgi:hypothetical protein